MSSNENAVSQDTTTEYPILSINRKGGGIFAKGIWTVTHFVRIVRKKANSMYWRLFSITSGNAAKADPIFQMTQDFVACVVIMTQ